MTMLAGPRWAKTSFAHLRRRAHGDGFHAARRGQRHRSGNQDDARAPCRRGFGQRIAHFAARAIGDIAHRVERLLRRSGCDQHHFIFQVAPLARGTPDGLHDLFRFGHAALAGHAASQVSDARFDHAVSAPPQRLQVGLRRGVFHMLTFMDGASITGPVKAR